MEEAKVEEVKIITRTTRHIVCTCPLCGQRHFKKKTKKEGSVS